MPRWRAISERPSTRSLASMRFQQRGHGGVVSRLTNYPHDRFDPVIAVNVKDVWLRMKHASRHCWNVVALDREHVIGRWARRLCRSYRLHRLEARRVGHDHLGGP